MNDLLLSEICSEQSDLLSLLVLIEKYVFDKHASNQFERVIAPVVDTCQDAIEGIDDTMAQAECLINALYVDELFIDKQRSAWPVLSCVIESAIAHRVLSPVVKAAVILHIINRCQLEAEIVYVPESVMVRIICDDVYSIIFDPITGESLNWEELDRRLDGLPNEPHSKYLEPMDKSSTIVEHLTLLKNSLISESKFDQALKCVDLLLAIKPEDPFERRDRGFLLHQLDCFKVAYDDYQYFVQQCPKDPAAQLLKLQLDNINLGETVLH
ncbi:tetratricopeptide repeat protein [Thalassotalea hakodatensis]|uniref:tetratricopeptide repeat protein n=1 Tax=Thalassotalea hakodatensis TaxID=3030492 RepID=UPI0025722DA1|nr:tetratricopeptide repeat protein [Thalassotalea hakodatensis]